MQRTFSASTTPTAVLSCSCAIVHGRGLSAKLAKSSCQAIWCLPRTFSLPTDSSVELQRSVSCHIQNPEPWSAASPDSQAIMHSSIEGTGAVEPTLIYSDKELPAQSAAATTWGTLKQRHFCSQQSSR